MSRRRLLGFAAVIAALLALLILTPAGSMLRGLVSSPGQKTAANHEDSRAGSDGSKGTPSKIDRPAPRPKLTAEETEALLKSTIIPEAHFDELTLVQWTSSLNKLIEDTGVDRRDLRVVLSHRVARHPLGSEYRWARRKLRNASVASILQGMTAGKSPLDYRIGEGTVEVGLRRGPEDESQSEAKVRAKLHQITIPIIDFEDTTVEEATDFLISRSIESDDATLDPAQKGICILIREPRNQGRSPGTTSEPEGGGGLKENAPLGHRTMTWRATNISVTDALDQITRRTGLQWEIDDFAITISPADPGMTPETLPPFPRPPIRPHGCFRGRPPKANSCSQGKGGIRARIHSDGELQRGVGTLQLLP